VGVRALVRRRRRRRWMAVLGRGNKSESVGLYTRGWRMKLMKRRRSS